MKICTTCGGSFEEDVMMCPNDGTPLFASAVAVEDDPEEVEEASSVDDAAIHPMVAEDDAEVAAAPEAEEAPASPEPAADSDDVAEVAVDTTGDTGADEPAPHTDTEEIVASLLAAEEPATPVPSEDDGAAVEAEEIEEVEVEGAEPPEDPFIDSAELPEVEPLPELDPIPGPELTDAPTPVPEESGTDSVLDLIEDSIADDSAILRIGEAEDPVSLDEGKGKKVVIPAKVEPKPSGGNKAIVVVAAILVIAILAAVGYFFVLPMLGG